MTTTQKAFDGSIFLYPTTDEIFYIKIPADTALYRNDGYIGYGKTIASVESLVYTGDGTNVSSAVINGTESISDNVIGIPMKYPTSFAEDGKMFYLRLKYVDNDGKTGEIPLAANIFTYDNIP